MTMRAWLSFRLNDQFERNEFDIASHAMDWALAAFDMDEQLRSWLKHGHEFKDAGEALYACREELHRILTDRKLDLDTIL